jgi:3-oxoacyl-[acyl-carrier protein] reductase
MNRKLALITGGTSGIGFGIAKKLATQYDLALSYAFDETKANESLQQMKSEFPDSNIQIFKQLLTNYQDCNFLYQTVSTSFSQGPSILVNSAGRLADGLFLQADFEKYKSVVDEHLIVTMALSQLCLKSMYKDRWGRIINLSSISANFSKRGQSNYAAAKAGIESFSKTLALEVAHRGVTVNCIAPGLIETPMTKNFVAQVEASDRQLKNRIPAGRMGKADEVGALAAFLCSEDAAYMTGTINVIDGGRSLGDSSS